MAVAIESLVERLEYVEHEVTEMRRELRRFLSAHSEGEAWARLAESAFAKDWDNELDAAYDDWRERYGVPE